MHTVPTEVRSALESLHQHALEVYGDRMLGLVLFGSHARGDARPDSDLDVAVVLSGSWRRAEEMERCAGLRQTIVAESGIHLDLAFLTPEEWEGHSSTDKSDIYATIRQEGRLLARGLSGIA
jgi:predicted nucleotidyltransferase